jgi:hypothetical protein
MVLNVTFNNISAISWRSVLLVEETRIIGEKPTTCHKSLKFDHIMLYQVHLASVGFELAMLVVIGTDCISSYKCNMITTPLIRIGSYTSPPM